MSNSVRTCDNAPFAPPKRLRFFAAAAFFTFLLVLAFPLFAAEPRPGGTLVFGVENNDFTGFDVIQARGFAPCDAIANLTMMERLFDLDTDGNLVPVLGLSAEASPDRLSWTIRLREGVRFHDGTPFTADAVTAHWNRLLNPENRFRGRQAFQPVRSVESAGDHTVVFHLAHPWILFPHVLASPRTAALTIPSPAAVAGDSQNRSPVGTGPFRFVRWDAGHSFTVEKNPDYWNSGNVHLERIVFRFMPDHQTRWASLQAGDIHAMWIDRGTIIRQAESDPAMRVHHEPDNGAEIILLNTANPPLDDPRVRRALAHAWNQARYVRLGYQDCIPVVEHPFGPDTACADCGYPAYDPDEAKRLLAAYGKPVELECLHSDTQRGREVGAVLQELCWDVGIRIRPVGLAFGPVIQKVVKGDYQLSTWRIPSTFDPGPGMVRSFHSKSRGNFSRYADPELDRLLQAQWTETEPAKRRGILCDIAHIVNRDVPLLYRGGAHHYVVTASGVKGLPPMREGIVDLTGAWIEP